MERSLIIIGPRETGKSRIARAFASQYKKDEVFYPSGNHIGARLYFSCATENTKLVIIDELKETKHLGLLISLYESIEVNPRGYDPFFINPKIIVVCNEKITFDDFPKGESFKRRFQIIECK